MKTDYGKDLTPVELAGAHAAMLCPRCSTTATDLRGTSMSQDTLAWRGRCFWNGPKENGFVCNKTTRDRLAK